MTPGIQHLIAAAVEIRADKVTPELELNAITEWDSRYWLAPFENYHTFCPYLVGSYGEVVRELARYLTSGYRTFILDASDDAELEHTRTAFEHAAAGETAAA